MAWRYEIDVPKRIVWTTLYGVLTPSDLHEHADKLRADPLFDPSFRQVIQVPNVDRLEGITIEALRLFARVNPFGPGSRRAIVAERDVQYGVSRTYQVFAERPGMDVRVFRDVAEALRWLDERPTT